MLTRFCVVCVVLKVGQKHKFYAKGNKYECKTLLTKIEEFIPNIKQLPKKIQFEIIVFGYDPDNIELDRRNTKNYVTHPELYL